MKQRLTHWCQRRFTPLLLSLGILGGSVLALATPASAYVPSTCSGIWYIHEAYPVGGGVWAWGTCVNSNTYVPLPDKWDYGSRGWGYVTLQIAYPSSNPQWVNAGENYEGGAHYVPTQDTSIAAYNCVSGYLYRTRVTWSSGFTFTQGRVLC